MRQSLQKLHPRPCPHRLIPCTEDLWEIAVDHINVGTPVLIEIHKVRVQGCSCGGNSSMQVRRSGFGTMRGVVGQPHLACQS